MQTLEERITALEAQVQELSSKLDNKVTLNDVYKELTSAYQAMSSRHRGTLSDSQ